jgi:hypothetical protein
LQAGGCKWIGKQCGALVDDVAAEQGVEALAIDVFGGDGPRWGQMFADGVLGFFGQQQATQPAVRIGKGRGDGVMAVQPDGALGCVWGAAGRFGLAVPVWRAV